MPSLNLADNLLPEELEFVESKVFRNGHLWEVKKRRNEFEICPHCAQKTSIQCGKAYSTVKEAPIRDTCLWLRIEKHRYYCKVCRKKFTEPVEGIWPRRKTTNHFRQKVAEDCERFTNLSLVRRRHRCSSGFLYEVHYEKLKRKLNERKGISWPTVLGVDEHFFTRRNGFAEFATVFCDLKKRRLFEMVLGKNGKSIWEQIESIPGREFVRVVVIDLSNGYRGIVKKLFPNAIIIADKFHALRLVTPALLKLRKQINGSKAELKQRRTLLRKREELEYETKREMDQYLAQHPALKELYWAKEKLRSFYRCRGKEKAKINLARMIIEFKNSAQEPLKRLARTLDGWWYELINYFKNRWTNGFTEATNGNAKALQKRARGYKNFGNYRLKTLNACFFKNA